MATVDDVRRLAMALPMVSERTSYGTPAWFAGKILMVRLREDFGTLAIKMTFEERERRMEERPDVFFLTDHYIKYPMVVAHLIPMDERLLEEVLRVAWRQAATLKMQGLLAE